MNDEQMEQKVYCGLDVYRLYDAHRFDLERETLTPTNIAETYRKHGFVPPSEQKRAA